MSMERLGLWGNGTAFANSKAFIDEIGKRGTGALELVLPYVMGIGKGALQVAMHMKARGSFLCRALSFRGAEFQIVNRHPSADFREMVTTTRTCSSTTAYWCLTAQYDQCCGIWAELFKSVSEQTDYFDKAGPEKKRKFNSTSFWGDHQSFWLSLSISAKIPAAIELIKEALEAGQCVVIGAQAFCL